MSLRRTIAHNTLFNAAGRIWEAVAGIGLTVYTIDRVGLDGFGLWSLVALFTGYAALFDFGLSSGFSKYVAAYAAKEDRAGVSAVVSTGVYFHVVLGALVVAIGWPLIDLLLAGTLSLMQLLNPGHAGPVAGDAPWAEARFLLRGALILFVATNCLAPFPALQMGLQRMGVVNALGFAGSLVKVSATVVFLELGFGVRGLLYTSAVLLGVMAVANIAVAYRIYPGLRCSPFQMQWGLFTTLFAFGWRSQVARLSNLVNFQTDRMIVALAGAGNLDLVGLYRAGEDLAVKMRQGPAMLVSALVPAVSDLDARDDRERLKILYIRSTKYVAALTVPLTLYFAAAADLLLSIYGTKSELGAAVWVVRILVLGYAFNVLPGPGVSIALGKGNAGMPMMAGIISMTANIALTVALFAAFGFYGIPAATALALGLSTAWFFRAMRSEVAVPPMELMRASLGWPTLAALPGTALCVLATWAASGYMDRIGNLVLASACAAAFGILYMLCLRLTPFLDAYDVALLRDTLRADRIPGFRFMTARVRDEE